MAKKSDLKMCVMFVLSMLVIGSVSGCSSKYIGDSMVLDTSENREVLKVVESYRQGVNDKDIDRLMSLTAEDFFDDPGTPHDPKDDFDRQGLLRRLEESFSKISDQRLDINVRKLEIDEDARVAHVDYVYDYRYKVKVTAGVQDDGFRTETDVNRMSFKLYGDKWMITNGI